MNTAESLDRNRLRQKYLKMTLRELIEKLVRDQNQPAVDEMNILIDQEIAWDLMVEAEKK